MPLARASSSRSSGVSPLDWQCATLNPGQCISQQGRSARTLHACTYCSGSTPSAALAGSTDRPRISAPNSTPAAEGQPGAGGWPLLNPKKGRACKLAPLLTSSVHLQVQAAVLGRGHEQLAGHGLQLVRQRLPHGARVQGVSGLRLRGAAWLPARPLIRLTQAVCTICDSAQAPHDTHWPGT